MSKKDTSKVVIDPVYEKLVEHEKDCAKWRQNVVVALISLAFIVLASTPPNSLLGGLVVKFLTLAVA